MYRNSFSANYLHIFAALYSVREDVTYCSLGGTVKFNYYFCYENKTNIFRLHCSPMHYMLTTMWSCPGVLYGLPADKTFFPLLDPRSLFLSNTFVPLVFPLQRTSPHIHSNSFSNLLPGIWWHLWHNIVILPLINSKTVGKQYPETPKGTVLNINQVLVGGTTKVKSISLL